MYNGRCSPGFCRDAGAEHVLANGGVVCFATPNAWFKKSGCDTPTARLPPPTARSITKLMSPPLRLPSSLAGGVDAKDESAVISRRPTIWRCVATVLRDDSTNPSRSVSTSGTF